MGSLTGEKAGGAVAKSKTKSGGASDAKKLIIAISLFVVAGIVFFLNPFAGRSERTVGGAMTMGGTGGGDAPAAPPPAGVVVDEEADAAAEAIANNPPARSHMRDPEAPPDPELDPPPPDEPPEPKDR